MNLSSMLKILPHLQANPDGLTVKELAGILGEPEDGIRKTLELMCTSPFYFPLYTSVGDNEEEEKYRLMSSGNYTCPQLSLTLDETIALFEVMTRAGSSGNFLKLRERIAGLFTAPPITRFYKGIDHLYREEEVREIKPVIEEALLQEWSLCISYQPKSEAAFEKIVYPLGLIRNSGTGFFYLLATESVTKESLKPLLYRLDRITAVKKWRRFTYPRNFDLHQFMKPLWSMELSTPVMVKVRFFNQVNVVAKARQVLLHRCPPGMLHTEEDGSMVFEGPVVGTESFRSWLRGFGSSVEVLEPEKMRQDMIATARELYRIYSQK